MARAQVVGYRMNNKKRTFLAKEIFSMVLQATVQRSRTYSNAASEEDKARFRGALRKALERLCKKYRRRVEEKAHIKNIKSLSDGLSKAQGDCLADRRFRIGSAQKALNLYLKYQWCLDWVDEPPHCPFDGFVIGRLPEVQNTKWTKLDRVDEYRELVAAAKNIAEKKGLSLAKWELQEYNFLAR